MQFPFPDQHVLPHEIPVVLPPDFSQNRDADRFVGSLVGLAVGDALGASVEFRPHQYFLDHPVRDMEGGGTWGLKTGQWTDDTSMALCLASSLITKKGYDPYDQMVRYKWWYKHGYLSSTGACFDIGNATRDSLEEFIHRQKYLINYYHCREDELDDLPWKQIQSVKSFKVNCSTEGVAGNGALMRLAPVPLFFYKYPALAVEYAGCSGRLTHGDRKAVDACRYYAALIVAAVGREPKKELLKSDFYESHRQWFGSTELHSDILRVAHGSYKNPKGYEGGIRGKGYIVNALEAALWAFWSDNDSFEKGALAAVNLGDDTDTTAAIYGQLAGASYGYKDIPRKWTEKLYANKLLVCIGHWLYFGGKQYKLTEEDQKIISSVQTPSIPLSSQHQDEQAFQPSMHVSSTNSLRTNQSSDMQLSKDQVGNRMLPVSHAGSSQSQTYYPNETQFSSRQAATDSSSQYGLNNNQRWVSQRPEEHLSIKQSNIKQTSTRRFNPEDQLESKKYGGYNITQTGRCTTQNDDVWKNDNIRRNLHESTYLNPTLPINSYNDTNPRVSYNTGYHPIALNPSPATFVNRNYLEYEYINGKLYRRYKTYT